jgi:hypothetical protein
MVKMVVKQSSIKGREFPDQLHEYQLLQEDQVPQSSLPFILLPYHDYVLSGRYTIFCFQHDTMSELLYML